MSIKFLQSHYYTPELRDIVAKLEATTIEKFGYEFEDKT